VRGVDSVVDLLHEEHARHDGTRRARPRVRAVRAVRAGWPPALRLAVVGAGAGLALVGLRVGGRVRAPLLFAGALLAACAASDVAFVRT
jgi:hypothetical protein